jgi:hypothetical protein
MSRVESIDTRTIFPHNRLGDVTMHGAIEENKGQKYPIGVPEPSKKKEQSKYSIQEDCNIELVQMGGGATKKRQEDQQPHFPKNKRGNQLLSPLGSIDPLRKKTPFGAKAPLPKLPPKKVTNPVSAEAMGTNPREKGSDSNNPGISG